MGFRVTLAYRKTREGFKRMGAAIELLVVASIAESNLIS